MAHKKENIKDGQVPPEGNKNVGPAVNGKTKRAFWSWIGLGPDEKGAPALGNETAPPPTSVHQENKEVRVRFKDGILEESSRVRAREVPLLISQRPGPRDRARSLDRGVEMKKPVPMFEGFITNASPVCPIQQRPGVRQRARSVEKSLELKPVPVFEGFINNTSPPVFAIKQRPSRVRAHSSEPMQPVNTEPPPISSPAPAVPIDQRIEQLCTFLDKFKSNRDPVKEGQRQLMLLKAKHVEISKNLRLRGYGIERNSVAEEESKKKPLASSAQRKDPAAIDVSYTDAVQKWRDVFRMMDIPEPREMGDFLSPPSSCSGAGDPSSSLSSSLWTRMSMEENDQMNPPRSSTSSEEKQRIGPSPPGTLPPNVSPSGSFAGLKLCEEEHRMAIELAESGVQDPVFSLVDEFHRLNKKNKSQIREEDDLVGSILRVHEKMEADDGGEPVSVMLKERGGQALKLIKKYDKWLKDSGEDRVFHTMLQEMEEMGDYYLHRRVTLALAREARLKKSREHLESVHEGLLTFAKNKQARAQAVELEWESTQQKEYSSKIARVIDHLTTLLQAQREEEARVNVSKMEAQVSTLICSFWASLVQMRLKDEAKEDACVKKGMYFADCVHAWFKNFTLVVKRNSEREEAKRHLYCAESHAKMRALLEKLQTQLAGEEGTIKNSLEVTRAEHERLVSEGRAWKYWKGEWPQVKAEEADKKIKTINKWMRHLQQEMEGVEKRKQECEKIRMSNDDERLYWRVPPLSAEESQSPEREEDKVDARVVSSATMAFADIRHGRLRDGYPKRDDVYIYGKPKLYDNPHAHAHAGGKMYRVSIRRENKKGYGEKCRAAVRHERSAGKHTARNGGGGGGGGGTLSTWFTREDLSSSMKEGEEDKKAPKDSGKKMKINCREWVDHLFPPAPSPPRFDTTTSRPNFL